MNDNSTEHFNIIKPDPETPVSEDVHTIRTAFDLIDALLKATSEAVAKKAEQGHTHDFADVDGLEEALGEFRRKDEVINIGDLGDVLNPDDAQLNYVLTKTALGFAFRSALSVLGEHQHPIANIVGLQDVLNSFVSGSAGSLDGEISVYQGTSGKALKRGGVKLADLLASIANKPDKHSTTGRLPVSMIPHLLGSDGDGYIRLTNAIDGREGFNSEIRLFTNGGGGIYHNGVAILTWGIEGFAGVAKQPTGNTHIANKGYVDTKVAAVKTGADTDYKQFTASGTWTKPAGLSANALVFVEVWGGGGGGGNYGAGGGGAYNSKMYRAAELGASIAVTVGAGGAGNTGDGSEGGMSAFGSLRAYGGGGGGNGAGSIGTNRRGGGGGGIASAGKNGRTGGAEGGLPYIGGLERGWDGALVQLAYGASNGRGSIHGGGGGGDTGGTSGISDSDGGPSVYGGGGGGGNNKKGGVSTYAGNGGAAYTNGQAPAGGGGRQASGARGEVRVMVIG